MPFATLEMSKIISHDVNNSFRQVYAGDEWDSPADKEDKEFKVTFGDGLPDGVIKDSVRAKHLVRGEKSIDKGYATTPLVFRVTFEDLSLIQQLRFMEYFHGKRPLAHPPIAEDRARGTTGILYEPAISDFQSTRASATEGLELPLWALDYLIANDYLELACKVIKLPGLPFQADEDKMSSTELNETLYELYRQRRAKEDSTANVIKSWAKRAKDKAAYLGLKECEEIAMTKANVDTKLSKPTKSDKLKEESLL